MIGAPPAPASTAPGRVSGTGGTSTWILRVNPLPRQRLADARQSQWLARLTRIDRELAILGPQCSAELYTQIGAAADAARKALLAVRRDIHNGRIPGSIPDGLGPAVTQWIELARSRTAVAAMIEGEYDAALGRERVRLAESLADPDFQRALALVAPEVHAAAIRYRDGASGGQALPQSIRKSERGLLQYLTRSMTRTSPLSRFTAVGLARLDPAGIRLDEVEFTDATAFVGVDVVMFNYVAGGLVAAHQETGLATSIGQSLQLRMDPDGGKVMFTREIDGKVRVRAVQVSDQILLIIELTSMGPRRLGAVARDIAARLGASAESAASALRTLLDAGMLCVAPGPEEIVASPIQALSAAVAPEQSARLLSLVNRLDQFGVIAPEARPAALADITAITTDLGRSAQRAAFMQVDEDYIIPPVAVATDGFTTALRDLASMVGFLSVFDRMHVYRAILTTLFVERFGAGAAVPLVSNAKALTSAAYQRYGEITQQTARELGPADGSLAELYALRHRLTELLLTKLAAHAHDPEMVISAAELAAAAAELPARFRAEPLSYGILVQPWRGQLIYNDGLAGHGVLFGRFLGADDELGGCARERLAQRVTARYGADGIRVTEDRGLHKLNVNARPATLADRLRTDDWFDLRLWHDKAADRLWILDPDDRRTHVFTFGTGNPELYPPPLRIASWLVSGSRLLVTLPAAFYQRSQPDPERTWPCPRVRAGQVIMSRRRWHGHAELDRAVAARGDAERLMALASWRSAYDVPEEIMFKSPPRRPNPGNGWAAIDARSRRDKPQYIDLSSALVTRVMPRLIERRPDGGYLEEALPGLADSPNVFEWVVEVSRPAFGDFSVEEA